MTDEERQQFVAFLKDLHEQNTKFLTDIDKSATKRFFEPYMIDKFKKRNAELSDYIIEIANGADYTRTLKEWCNLFGDIIVGSDYNGSH